MPPPPLPVISQGRRPKFKTLIETLIITDSESTKTKSNKIVFIYVAVNFLLQVIFTLLSLLVIYADEVETKVK